MQYIGHTIPKMLIADEGKALRAVNAPQNEVDENGEPIPREPITVVFLADGIDEDRAREMYVEG